MKVLIKVTKDVIKKSTSCDGVRGFNCAIALAIRELLPHSVRCTTITYYIHEYPHIQIPLPQIAREFINKFDSLGSHEREELEPISFEIDLPITNFNFSSSVSSSFLFIPEKVRDESRGSSTISIKSSILPPESSFA